MHYLEGHESNKSHNFQVQSRFDLISNHLEISFDVKKENLVVNEKFNLEDWNNWGLWESDVVEVFLTKDEKKLPYLELQVSPLNQKFALLIHEPRKRTEEIRNISIETITQKTESGFLAHFKIPIDLLPGSGNQIYGNLHACLHEENETCYFAYNKNLEAKADFHLPKYFKLLGKI